MPKLATIFFLLCLISFSGCTNEGETPPKQGQTASETRVALTAPLPGQRIRHIVQRDNTYLMNYDPTQVRLSTDSDSLFISFDDGGRIELTDFFKPEIINFVKLETEDGNQIEAPDILNSLMYEKE